MRNTRYTGKLIWNASRKVRVPGTGKRIKRSRPESERVVVNAPDLRIVTGELFESVQRRFAVVSRLWGRKSGRRGLADCSPRQVYLFSGLLRCGQCGGRISLVSGRGRRGYAKYGCALHHERGVCSNDLTIRRDELERRLLDRLQESVLREEAIDYVVARLEEEITKRFAEFDTELERLRQQKQKAELEIARFVQAIAEGQPSPSLMEAIGEREKELRAISDKLLEPRPGSIRAKLDELRTFAISRLTDLRKLLSHPETVNEARALLTEHIGKIVLFPVQENGKRSYQARGAVDFFFGQEVAHADGAGGRS